MEEKNLTNEEIVQALEHCCGVNGRVCDRECVFWKMGKEITKLGMNCQDYMNAFALDLIHRLQDENERLTKENVALSKGVKRLKKRYEEAIKQNADECVKKFCETTMYAEQERLLKENAELQKQVDELKKAHTSLCDECADYCPRVPQAVKDTAKEIYGRVLEWIPIWGGYQKFIDDFEGWLKERYGVEVE